MVEKLLVEGHEVTVWNRSSEAIEQLKEKISPLHEAASRFTVASDIEDLTNKLKPPRIIWIMLPSDVTEAILTEVDEHCEAGDIIINGGNSNYKDSEKRYLELKERRIKYLGIGVSGGLVASKEGYPLMAGGDHEAYEHIKPVLEGLSKPHGGHEYFGEGGAGHFVKMVHNGIEYGIMQSLGEGFGVLEKAPYKFHLDKVAKLWRKGTLVSGFMLDRTAEVLEKDPKLEKAEGIIGATGEGKWTIDQAEEEQVPAPVIKESLRFRVLSQEDEAVQKSFAARLVAALRKDFGGHEVKKI